MRVKHDWFPLVINRDQRNDYIDALELADNGEMEYLVDLFASIQRNAFVKALSISESVLKDQRNVAHLIASGKDLIQKRRLALANERQRVFDIAETLIEISTRKLAEVGEQLTIQLGSVDENYYASVDGDSEKLNTDHYYRRDIVTTANDLKYYADTGTYRKWIRLRIREDEQTDLIISIHSLGKEFLGVLAVSSFILHKDIADPTNTNVEGPVTLCRYVFQFSYNEDSKQVEDRYDPWLNEVILTGLDQWRLNL